MLSILYGISVNYIILPNPPFQKEDLSLPFVKGDLEGFYNELLKLPSFFEGIPFYLRKFNCYQGLHIAIYKIHFKILVRI